MTDETESKVRQWALKRNGVPLAVHDVVELCLAIDADANQRHETLVGGVSSLEERLSRLEDEHANRATTCPLVVAAGGTLKIGLSERDLSRWWQRTWGSGAKRFFWLALGGIFIVLVNWIFYRLP